jgi:NhaP-type Na+/H+ and K+/H+ antiporter
MEVTTEMLDNGTRLKDIKFDSKLLIIMVRRGEEFFVPTGDSELEVGDQLLIISDSAANATEQFIEDSDAEIYDHWGMYLINHTMDFAKQKWNQLLHPKKEKKF